MPQILIDRELLQRILDDYFESEADRRAHLAIAQRGVQKHPEASHAYFEAHARECEQQLSQTEGFRDSLSDQLRTQDDDAFLAALNAQFSARQRRAKKSRKPSPPPR